MAIRISGFHSTKPSTGRLADVCSCGNAFLPDAAFCRRCGLARQKIASPPTTPTTAASPRGIQMAGDTFGMTTHSVVGPSEPIVAGGFQACPTLGAPAPGSYSCIAPPSHLDISARSLPDMSMSFTHPAADSVGYAVNASHLSGGVASNVSHIGVGSPRSYTAPAPRVTTLGVTTPLPPITVQACDGVVATSGGVTTTLNPALRAWLESLVDERVEQTFRYREGEFLRSARDGVSAHAVAAAQDLHHQGHARLGAELRGLADSHARMHAVVEGHKREHAASSQALADLQHKLHHGTHDVRRSLEQEGLAVSSRLREHEAALADLQKALADDSSRHRGSISELQKLLNDSLMRQRQSSEELVNACSSIAGTRQEVGDLAQVVQRLETKLSSWCAEVASEVAEEVRTANAARDATLDADRQRLEAVHREVTSLSTHRMEIDSRLESLRRELGALSSSRGELEGRMREGQQALTRRLESMGKELSQRVEQRYVPKDSFLAHQSAATQREAALRDHSIGSAEDVRREVSVLTKQLQVTLEDRIERLQVELATGAASKEAFEFRHREGLEEVRKSLDMTQGSFRDELVAHMKRSSSELRAEVRAALKNEQNAIAALDEQLWLTDQRLGQRIDEVVHSVEAAARVQPMAASEVKERGSPSLFAPPRSSQRPITSRRDVTSHLQLGGLLGDSPSEPIAGENGFLGAPPMASKAAEAFASIGMFSPRSEGVGSNGAGRDRLSDAEQLERLRSARRHHGMGA
eukprot:TRINITY_DN25628_c0_g1_i1.p1 TRINITY_DN25628_c0_g1~~TRINITY_DN25628_c0_g1_i1.p1  ORF type:complete len:753 (-),score=163.62 TRINITY_DN25628_c0_g1_i1:203-2461(-)